MDKVTEYMYLLGTPEGQEAIRLARAFRTHCIKNHLPPDIVLYGVALNAFMITEKAHKEGYIEGKAYEKGRLAQLLGLV